MYPSGMTAFSIGFFSKDFSYSISCLGNSPMRALKNYQIALIMTTIFFLRCYNMPVINKMGNENTATGQPRTGCGVWHESFFIIVLKVLNYRFLFRFVGSAASFCI